MAHETGIDGRDHDAMAGQLIPQAVGVADEGEFPTVYGSKCGTATFPPIEAILTIRPSPWRLHLGNNFVHGVKSGPEMGPK